MPKLAYWIRRDIQEFHRKVGEWIDDTLHDPLTLTIGLLAAIVVAVFAMLPWLTEGK